MNSGSFTLAHDSKSLASPPLPNSWLGPMTVPTTSVGTEDIGGNGLTDAGGVNVAIGASGIVGAGVIAGLSMGTGVAVGAGVIAGLIVGIAIAVGLTVASRIYVAVRTGTKVGIL